MTNFRGEEDKISERVDTMQKCALKSEFVIKVDFQGGKCLFAASAKDDLNTGYMK